VFTAAAAQGEYILVFIALVNTIISLYYYLLVVKAMFINQNDQPIARVTSDGYLKLSLVLCLVGMVVLGLLGGVYEQLTNLSFGLS